LAVLRKFLLRLARTSYVQGALASPVDTSLLRRRPTKREGAGLFLVLLSYILGWPAVAFFGYLAYRIREPLVLGIGGPVIYGFSHVVFFVGAYLAGADTIKTFMRWATRKGFERLLGPQQDPVVDRGARQAEDEGEGEG
jgi:hypothetical protein